MNFPDQEQIDHWLSNAKYQIDRKWKLYNEGYHKRKNISVQGMYTSLGMMHATLARAKFLNGDSLDEVRAEFSDAARHVLKCFTMAYDPNDPDYVGNKEPPPECLGSAYGYVSWSKVDEITFTEGASYALMAADFDLARTLAQWFRRRPDGRQKSIEVNQYAHALAATLKDDIDEAKRLMTLQALGYTKKPAKGTGARANFFTLSTALIGILDRDDELFNQGLLTQLQFYQHEAQGEAKNTTYEFVCDDAVGLANLGLHHGLTVTVEYDTLPKGLLIKA